MIQYEVMPVVDSYEIERALKEKFGPDVMGNEDVVANVLFDDYYSNDSCKHYCFSEDKVYEGHSWQNEERIRICNCVNAMLREVFPDCDAILVDVSW
jgi:hypothetical protein